MKRQAGLIKDIYRFIYIYYIRKEERTVTSCLILEIPVLIQELTQLCPFLAHITHRIDLFPFFCLVKSHFFFFFAGSTVWHCVLLLILYGLLSHKMFFSWNHHVFLQKLSPKKNIQLFDTFQHWISRHLMSSMRPQTQPSGSTEVPPATTF